MVATKGGTRVVDREGELFMAMSDSVKDIVGDGSIGVLVLLDEWK